MIRLGFQIPKFDFPGVGTDRLFQRVCEMAGTAERSGFDSIFVMDHMYQLPMLGPTDADMLEAYVLLGALAATTETAMLGSLVTGNTYRNPAHLAKIVTSLDVISGGRAILGIGAGWFEPEHDGYGWDFGTFGERFDKLEEALKIVLPMMRDQRPTLDSGAFYRTDRAINRPTPIQEDGPPLLIGGAGEHRTLRIAAQHAQYSNMPVTVREIPHKLDVLFAHLASEGRAREDIGVSILATLIIGPTNDSAIKLRDEFVGSLGVTWEHVPSELKGRIICGGPDEVAEQAKAIFEMGMDGIIVNMPANGHDTEMIALAGETLSRALG